MDDFFGNPVTPEPGDDLGSLGPVADDAGRVVCIAGTDDPRWVAWEAFKKTDRFRKSQAAARSRESVNGALWSAFVEGWKQARKEMT